MGKLVAIMKMKNCFLMLLNITMLLFCTTISAYADFPVPKIIMQCDAMHNRILVRFGALDVTDLAPNTVVTLDQFRYGVQQAPTDLTKFWATIPFQIGGRCNFHDSRTVNLSLESGPSSASNPVPDEYFSMSVGRKVIYRDRMAYRGDDTQTYPISAIQLVGNTLLECAPSSSDPNSPASVCHDETPRLRSGAKLPEPEAWALRRDRRREQLEAALNPFCRAVNRLPRGRVGENRFPDALYLSTSSPTRAVLFGDTNVLADLYRLNSAASSDQGIIVRIFNFTHFFNGSALVSFQRSGADIEAFFNQAGSIDIFGTDFATRLRRNFGAILIDTAPREILSRSNLSPRYFNYNLLRYKGFNYVYWSTLDRRSVPSGLLSRIMPDGTTRMICQFP